jgi:uncharacterized protein YkwD
VVYLESRRSFLGLGLFILALFVLMSISFASIDYSYGAFSSEVSQTQVKYSFEILKLVNKERSKRGLNPLVMDEELFNSAIKRANELTVVFAHTRPNGKSWNTINSNRVYGENILCGKSKPEEVVKLWMNSPTHRANLLRADFKSIGIAYLYNPTAKSYNPSTGETVAFKYYWVQLFDYDIVKAIDSNGNPIIDKKAPVLKSTNTKTYKKIKSKKQTLKIKFSEDLSISNTTLKKIKVKTTKGKTIKATITVKRNYLYVKIPKVSKKTKFAVYIPKKAVKDLFNNKLNKKIVLKYTT